MPEFSDKPSDDQFDDPFDYIVANQLADLEYSSIAQASVHFSSVMNSNLDKISLIAYSHFEPAEPAPDADMYKMAGIEAEAFGAVAAVIMGENGTVEDRLAELLSYYLHSESERAHAFNQIVPTGEDDYDMFFARNKTGLERELNKHIEEAKSTEAAISGMKNEYLQDVLGDYTLLMEHLDEIVKERTESEQPDKPDTPREIELYVRKSGKEHLIDVTKIAAGVLGALAVDRLLRRK